MKRENVLFRYLIEICMCIVWLASVNLFKLNVYLVSKTRNFGVNKEYVGALKLTSLRLLV